MGPDDAADVLAAPSRRAFIAGAIALATAALAEAGPLAGRAAALPAGDLFPLGVASGDPSDDGVVLWTRLLAPGGDPLPVTDVPVDWEVATDAGFASVVASGTAPAVAALAHSVHVEVDGLASDSWFFYRFHADGRTSPVGRTRTFPGVGRDALAGPLRPRQLPELQRRVLHRPRRHRRGRRPGPGRLRRRLRLRGRGQQRRAPVRAPDGHGRAHLPRPLRALQAGPEPPGVAPAGAVGHHHGRPRGRQQRRRRPRARRVPGRATRPASPRTASVGPTPSRSGTSTSRCASRRPAAPTTSCTASWRTRTCCASSCSTGGSTAAPTPPATPRASPSTSRPATPTPRRCSGSTRRPGSTASWPRRTPVERPGPADGDGGDAGPGRPEHRLQLRPVGRLHGRPPPARPGAGRPRRPEPDGGDRRHPPRRHDRPAVGLRRPGLARRRPRGRRHLDLQHRQPGLPAAAAGGARRCAVDPLRQGDGPRLRPHHGDADAVDHRVRQRRRPGPAERAGRRLHRRGRGPCPNEPTSPTSPRSRTSLRCPTTPADPASPVPAEPTFTG